MQLWLIPLLPLAGFAVNGLFGRRFSKAVVNTIAVGSVLLSFLWVLKTLSALGAFNGGLEEAYREHYYTWIQSGALSINVDFAIDRLTAVWLMIVTGVGLLIHIYAVGYMAHEGGYYRFFAYLNLFMFFMLVLVLGANFLLLFVGWEGVGLCSYLLIGFYFLEKFATDAGNKAFIVNRIGDFGFALAIFLIGVHFKSLDFSTVFSAIKPMPVEAEVGWITAAGLLLLVGATGKSAQIPLYVWLPDAMAGPTPVSALIHAATMVTAGVYMVARSSQIYLHSAFSLDVVAIIGIATAFIAATIGLCQNDIKKVFAYSTVSQLGYMFVGLGTGAFSAGVFHVMTHAFFKALLFLGAGSVIHALSGEQDLRKMGGLAKKIPITCITLFCAGVAIAGVPPFSGFHSKDAILEAAYEHAPWIYWVGVITAGMTAFYVFRALFLCFFGEYRGPAEEHMHGHGHDDHGHAHGGVHESPAVMWVPLAILAVLSLGGGYINIPRFLEPLYGAEHDAPAWLMYVSVVAGLLGIAVAYLFYVVSPSLPEALAKAFSGPYRWIYNKYYVDEFYDSTVVRPVVDGSREVLWRGADVDVIDGAVNGVGTFARATGALLRRAQSGYIRSYAAWVLAGSILVVVLMGFVWVGR
ncbi:MAG: NADH-quinone oxidoreductase subunit L [Bryobacterales bacterium]|nr:NADH-quinone oxidoreductase subunit L [Bryobacterales bacterium]MBV9397951.1 NADH-quinone oxidoreductase subunit L [Bryobacterales bacterium]